MDDRGTGRSKAVWTLFALLLLASRFPAKASSEAQSGPTPRSGAAARPEGVSRKPAWTWTVEERLAKRFDPKAMAARAAEEAEKEKAFRARNPELAEDPLFKTDYPGRPLMETIDGAETPELFMVWELFTFFVDRAFPVLGSDNSHYRQRIEQRAAALGFGHDMWTRLEVATSPFNGLMREARLRPPHPAKPKKGFVMDSEDLHWCRVRAQAIANAKAEFGEEAFLRLLYEVIAPDQKVSGVYTASGLAERYRFMEGGCK
jgi:hypothetical protein